MTTELLHGGLVAGMVLISIWGGLRIPKESRVPFRFGGTGFQTTMGKGTALVLWPGLGALIAFGNAWVGEVPSADVLRILSTLALGILLVSQLATLRRLVD